MIGKPYLLYIHHALIKVGVATFAVIGLLPITASALCVDQSVANLRRGPSTKFPITWKVGKYMPLKEIGRKGGWIRVKDLDGSIHWAHRSIFDMKKSFQCVAVKSNYTNLRRRPSAKAALAEMSSADKYSPFKDLDRDGNWIRVVDDYGNKAWIYSGNLWRPTGYLKLNF